MNTLALKTLPRSGVRWAKEIGSRSQGANTLPFWVAGAITGVVAAGYAWVFRRFGDWGARWIAHHTGSEFYLAPTAFLVSWILVRQFSPAAAGSGIPQVITATELDHHEEKKAIRLLLGLRVAAIKILSSWAAVLGGAAIGREGPTIQIGASLFQWIGHKTSRFFPGIHPKTWVLAGGAAGIAAAFNTPLGGIVFAIEELSRESFRQFKTAVLVGVIVAGLVAQWFTGSYLYLGTPRITTLGVEAVLSAIVIGGLGGILGGLFGAWLFALNAKRRKIQGFWKQAGVVAALGLTFALLARLSGGMSLGPGTEGIGSLLFQGEHGTALHVGARYLASILSYLAGGAGGIFAPSLSIGAQLGSWISFDFLTGSDAVLGALLGMIAFLAGVTHAPFTSFVLVLEMTDRQNAIFPMMLAAVVAQMGSRIIAQHSFYERMSGVYLEQIKAA